MEKIILTLDLGTTGVKVSLFTTSLVSLACVTKEYSLTTLPNGKIELDPTVWLKAIKEGIAQAREEAKLTGSICAISTTTQGETIIPVDKNGTPLHPAVVWLDSRATAQADTLSRAISPEEFYSHTGLPEISGALPIAKLMWFKEELPEIYNKAEYFLLAEDFILNWLTGKFVSEKSLQCSTGWFDIKSDCVFTKAISIAGVDINKLPPMLSCGELVGKVKQELIAELSLDEGCVAVTAAMDQTAAAVGAGCIKSGLVVETTGTALVMAAYTDNPNFELAKGITIYRHAIDGAYLYLPIGNTAGMALKWFRDNLCGDISYRELDDLASLVPAGSGGLIMLPYLEGCVNPVNLPTATAAFFGATLSTTRGHFARAVMEAIGYQLREFLDILSPLGVNPNEVYSLGGGAKSELWQQIKADCCDTAFVAAQNTEAASLGAATLALKALSLPFENLTPLFEKSKRYTPTPSSRDACDTGYITFKRLRDAVTPLY